MLYNDAILLYHHLFYHQYLNYDRYNYFECCYMTIAYVQDANSHVVFITWKDLESFYEIH